MPEGYICAQTFPKVFAWVARFKVAGKAAAEKAGKTKTLSDTEALRQVEEGGWAEEEGSVDECDPVGLRKGEVVEVWPTDSGSRHRDRGSLVALDGEEVVVEGRTEGGVGVRIHAPRHGFRVRRIEGPSL